MAAAVRDGMLDAEAALVANLAAWAVLAQGCPAWPEAVWTMLDGEMRALRRLRGAMPAAEKLAAGARQPRRKRTGRR